MSRELLHVESDLREWMRGCIPLLMVILWANRADFALPSDLFGHWSFSEIWEEPSVKQTLETIFWHEHETVPCTRQFIIQAMVSCGSIISALPFTTALWHLLQGKLLAWQFVFALVLASLGPWTAEKCLRHGCGPAKKSGKSNRIIYSKNTVKHVKTISYHQLLQCLRFQSSYCVWIRENSHRNHESLLTSMGWMVLPIGSRPEHGSAGQDCQVYWVFMDLLWLF